jgi:hypothetical protein
MTVRTCSIKSKNADSTLHTKQITCAACDIHIPDGSSLCTRSSFPVRDLDHTYSRSSPCITNAEITSKPDTGLGDLTRFQWTKQSQIQLFRVESSVTPDVFSPDRCNTTPYVLVENQSLLESVNIYNAKQILYTVKLCFVVDLLLWV